MTAWRSWQRREDYYSEGVLLWLDVDARPNNWAAFLNQHLQTHGADEALAGLGRAGWKLVYSDVPTDTFRQSEAEAGVTNLGDSIGLEVDAAGRIQSVQWDGMGKRFRHLHCSLQSGRLRRSH